MGKENKKVRESNFILAFGFIYYLLIIILHVYLLDIKKKNRKRKKIEKGKEKGNERKEKKSQKKRMKVI